MVIEKVVFDIAPGREEAFLAFAEASRPLLEGAPGCRGFSYGRGVEDPSTVIFIVGWDSIEAHRAATQQPGFAEFGRTLAGFVTRRASPAHYAMTGALPG